MKRFWGSDGDKINAERQKTAALPLTQKGHCLICGHGRSSKLHNINQKCSIELRARHVFSAASRETL